MDGIMFYNIHHFVIQYAEELNNIEHQDPGKINNTEEGKCSTH
jgi:hypothetical protein